MVHDCFSLGMQVVFFTSPFLWVTNLGFIYAYVSRFNVEGKRDSRDLSKEIRYDDDTLV